MHLLIYDCKADVPHLNLQVEMKVDAKKDKGKDEAADGKATLCKTQYINIFLEFSD